MGFDNGNAERPLTVMALACTAVNTYHFFLGIPFYLIVSRNKSYIDWHWFHVLWL